MLEHGRWVDMSHDMFARNDVADRSDPRKTERGSPFPGPKMLSSGKNHPFIAVAMLRTNQACARLLLLEDEHSQGWRPGVCAGLPGGYHSGGLSLSVTAPVLLRLLPPSIRLGRSGEELVVEPPKDGVRVIVKPA